MNNLEQCLDDLKKLYGLYPYNDSMNTCKNDNYFGKYIRDTYSPETIEEAKRLLKW